MKEGTIVRRTCPIPLITHTGIILIEDEKVLVCHNTGIKSNEFGGSVIIESLEDFLKLGRILSQEETEIESTKIKSFQEQKKFVRYNPLTYNCEDFLNELIHSKRGSPQRRNWLIGIGGLLLLNQVRKSKMKNLK